MNRRLHADTWGSQTEKVTVQSEWSMVWVEIGIAYADEHGLTVNDREQVGV